MTWFSEAANLMPDSVAADTALLERAVPLHATAACEARLWHTNTCTPLFAPVHV
jgi:hypothetical protein